jgi:DNA (cytosine-5)-methyltransferase 1
LTARVLDLFCGCGGLSLGFQSVGFNITAGVDNDTEALGTFSKNFPGAIAHNADMTNLAESFTDSLGKIDVILGGPPCQGFSIAGKRNAKDPRNTLTNSYIEIVGKLDPRIVVIENVTNILGMGNGIFRETIIKRLESLGYSVSIEKLLASEFGVPQHRKRVFFIGVKGDHIWANEIDNLRTPKLITCADALDDLPALTENIGSELQDYRLSSQNDYQSLMRDSSEHVFNHIAVEHKERTKQIIAMVPDGGNYKDLPLELQGTRKVNIAWTRMNSQKPCFTIDAGHNHHFHYRYNRVPTVRECARIQSFPDKFIFLGKRTSQYKQVGNAVPPLLAEKLASILASRV